MASLRAGGGAGGGGGSLALRSMSAPTVLGDEGAGGGGGGGGDDGTHDGEYSGWLLKAAPKVEDVDKEDSVARRMRRVATALVTAFSRTSDFKRRFFVLDGTELRYYKDAQRKVYSGMVDLSTVLEVRWTDRQGLPLYSFELCTDARVFTMSPSPASEASAREWFTRLQNKLEASRRRGMLAKSLKGTVVLKRTRAAATVSRPPWADATGAVDGTAFPLYLSHEACRLATDDLLTTGLNVTAASGGAAASSSLQVLIGASPSVTAMLKRAGVPGSQPAVVAVATHEVTANRLNQLIVDTGLTGHGPAGGDGGGGGGAGGADSAALASTSAAVSVGVFDSAAAAAAGKLLRRGSLVFAAADIAAKPWRSVPDPVLFATGQRRDRSGTGGGRPMSGAFSSPAATAAPTRRQSMFARLLSGGPAAGEGGGGGTGLASPARPRSVRGPRPSSPGFALPPAGSPDAGSMGRGTPDSAAGGAGRSTSPALGGSATARSGGGGGAGGSAGTGWYNAIGAQGAIAGTATGSGVGPKVRRFRRRMRTVSRWEELSGNMPRWALSIVDEHRLKHTPLFSPVVGLGPGQAGFVDPLSAFMQTVGEAGEGVAGVFGGIAAMIATGGKQRKKDGKGDGKDKKKAGKGGGGGGEDDDDDDDDDEEEDEEEEEELGGDDVDVGEEAGAVFTRLAAANELAASAAPASAGPSTPSAVIAARAEKASGGKGGVLGGKTHRGGMLAGGGDGHGAAVGPGVGPAGLQLSDIEAMDRALGGKRLARELRGRLACMRARVTFAELNNPSAFHGALGTALGGGSGGSGGYVGPPTPAITAEATAVTALQATALQLMAARGNVDAEMVGLQFGNADSGSSLAGARGRERALLLSLTQRERGHLTAMRSQAEEYAKLGWDVKVGVPSLPQSTFHSTVTRSATGVTLLVTPRSRSSSIAAAGGNLSAPGARRALREERRRSASMEAASSAGGGPKEGGEMRGRSSSRGRRHHARRTGP